MRHLSGRSKITRCGFVTVCDRKVSTLQNSVSVVLVGDTAISYHFRLQRGRKMLNTASFLEHIVRVFLALGKTRTKHQISRVFLWLFGSNKAPRLPTHNRKTFSSFVRETPFSLPLSNLEIRYILDLYRNLKKQASNVLLELWPPHQIKSLPYRKIWASSHL